MATLKVGTPIFNKRVKVSAALLVCRVDNTKCPVCAALIAISSVYLAYVVRFEDFYFFDNGNIVNSSYYTLDTNDHLEMETFSISKTVPSGASAITKVAIQARTNTFPFPAQVGYMDELIIETENSLGQF